MATPEHITIRVYRKDKALLNKKYAGNDDQAFHELISKNCPHPEENRTIVAALLPLIEDGDEAITENKNNRVVGGYFCSACNTYVFSQRGQIAIPPLPTDKE